MTACGTCALVRRRDAGEAPPWDQIRRTAYWDVVHGYATAVEGWLILVARRHVAAVADLTDDEAAELGPLITATSRALHAAVGCAKTYVAQFAEHPDHHHVHVHVIPRAADLPAEARGPRVFGLLDVPEDQQVPEGRRNEIAAAVRRRLPR